MRIVSLDLVNVYAHLFVQACNGILISFCQLLALIVIAIEVIRALVIFLNERLQSPDLCSLSKEPSDDGLCLFFGAQLFDWGQHSEDHDFEAVE